jgi:hypothetical protein
VTIMEATVRAAQRKFDREVTLAWHIAAMSGAAQAGKLKKLSHYLPKKPSRPQAPSEMLAVLREFQSRGAGMTFTHRPN